MTNRSTKTPDPAPDPSPRRFPHLGFRMDEEMTGWHEFLPGEGPAGRLPFSFQVAWGVRDFRECLRWDQGRPHLVVPLEGVVRAGGLCAEAPCRGTLDLRYLVDRRLVYDFTFACGDREFHYVGQKVNVLPHNLPVSHTTCFGTLTDAGSGRLLSRGVTHFRLRTLPAFLASFRPRLG
ncbi:hypothetical protein KBD49_05570 [Myxococcota bacterium]|nr:hypothetical protein [Myxococcota bacterium]